MRYWLYKCNIAGGPAGYSGDWRADVFRPNKEVQWGGDYATESAEVHKHLAETVAAGDVIVAYQTDARIVVGFCVITRMEGARGGRKIWLTPIHQLTTGFPIHDHKRGTALETSSAVRGMVMMRELERSEMDVLVRLARAPANVLLGKATISSKPMISSSKKPVKKPESG